MPDSHDPLSSQEIISTPRLVLRAASESDIPVIAERVLGNPDVMRHVFLGEVMAKDSAERFMREHFAFGDKRVGIAILTEKPSGNVIGFGGLFPCDALEADDLEIGFVMIKETWGKGYASEIGEAQLKMGFDEFGYSRLLGLVHPDNAASIRALTKLGMRYVKHVTSPKRPPRSVYVLSRKEWRDRRSEQRG